MYVKGYVRKMYVCTLLHIKENLFCRSAKEVFLLKWHPFYDIIPVRSKRNHDLPNAKPSPLWGEGVERSETDEGDVPTGRRLNIRIGGRYPPHPSSGFRETPDATFPPEGGRLCRSPGKLPVPSLVPYCLLVTSKNSRPRARNMV